MGVGAVVGFRSTSFTSTSMWGMDFDAESGLLVSPATPTAGPGVDWRTLNPDTGAWTSRPLVDSNSTHPWQFTALDGNLGSVRSFDAESGTLHTLIGAGEGDDDREHTTNLASIDIATGTITSHAELGGDVGRSGSILLLLA